MNILIVKTGALGDVVRTQYFAKYLHEQHQANIYWLANPDSAEILIGNPHIIAIYTNIEQLLRIRWDHIYNLEDDSDLVARISKLECSKFSGLYYNDGMIEYTSDTNDWNDMGIHSRFGIEQANKLKLQNKNSHLKIFSQIFNVDNVIPNWKGLVFPKKDIGNRKLKIGLNLFAGKRWPNKSASANTVRALLEELQNSVFIESIDLIGAFDDWKPYIFIASKSRHITTHTIESLSHVLRECDILISSDSLAVHVSASVGTPYVCFFGPTSAEEIKVPNIPYVNVSSQPPGFCSYNPNAVITGIDQNVLISALHSLIHD